MKHRILIVLGVTGLAMLATAATNFIPDPPARQLTQITPEWVVDLRTVLAVGSVVFPSSIGVVVFFWKFSEKIAVRLQQGDDRFKNIELALTELKAELREHRQSLDKLPCRGWSNCPADVQPKKR